MLMSKDSPFQSILAAKVMSCCMDVQSIFRRLDTLRGVSQDAISHPFPSCRKRLSATRSQPSAEPLNTKGTGGQHAERPYEGRGNISYLEITLRHTANTGHQRDYRTKWAKKAADKGTGHTPLFKEGMSALKHLRMF